MSFVLGNRIQDDFSFVYFNLLEFNYNSLYFIKRRDFFCYRNRFGHKNSFFFFNKNYIELNKFEKFFITYGIFNRNIENSITRFVSESKYPNIGFKMNESNFVSEYIEWRKTIENMQWYGKYNDNNNNKIKPINIVNKEKINLLMEKHFYIVRKGFNSNQEVFDLLKKNE